ncbi:MAG: hypothetical protein ACEPOV_14320 [Hyphomicrobiales bacterium]
MKTIKRLFLFLLFLISHFMNGQDIFNQVVFPSRISVLNSEKNTEVISVTEKEINIRNDRVYYWFRSGKINSTQGDYGGKLLDGKYVMYDSNERMLLKGEFKEGLKNDLWLEWDLKGNLLRTKLFKYGILKRSCEYKKGVKVLKSFFKRGVLKKKYRLIGSKWERIFPMKKEENQDRDKKRSSLWVKIKRFIQHFKRDKNEVKKL